MANKDDQYFLVTPPMEFIRDIRDIMQDGDGLAPEALAADIVGLLNNYVLKHNTSLNWQFLELGWECEKLPASTEQTEIMVKLGELREQASRLTQRALDGGWSCAFCGLHNHTSVVNRCCWCKTRRQ